MSRCRAVVAAAAALCAAASAFTPSALIPSALAGRFVDRVEIAPGDTLLADVLAPQEFDEIVARLPRGASVRWEIRRVGGFVPAVGAMYDEDYAGIAMTATPPAFLDTAPLPRSGLFRLLLTSGRDRLGAYRVRLTARPQRTAAFQGTGDTAPGPIVFGAFPDAEVDVTLKWKGDAPVTLASLTGPDGATLSAPAAVVRGQASTQRGFRTSALGDQTAAVVVPPGTVSWSARFAIRTPRIRGSVKDLRTAGLPEPATVRADARSVQRAGTSLFDSIPWIVVLGENGGSNGWVLGSGTTTPSAFPNDPRRGGCSFDYAGDAAAATTYVFACTAGYRARIEDVVRDGQGRVLSFDAPVVVDPQGAGSSSFAGFTYDAAGDPTGWTEVRRFDASGRTHELTVSGLTRFPSGLLRTFTLRHVDPDGAVRLYDYGPYQ